MHANLHLRYASTYSLRIGVKDGRNSIALEKLAFALILSSCFLTEIILKEVQLANTAMLGVPCSVIAT